MIGLKLPVEVLLVIRSLTFFILGKNNLRKKDAENERLKEALKWISDKTLEWENINAIGNPDNQVIQWWHLGDKARYTLKALKEVTNETDYRAFMPESE